MCAIFFTQLTWLPIAKSPILLGVVVYRARLGRSVVAVAVLQAQVELDPILEEAVFPRDKISPAAARSGQ